MSEEHPTASEIAEKIAPGFWGRLVFFVAFFLLIGSCPVWLLLWFLAYALWNVIGVPLWWLCTGKVVWMGRPLA